MNGMGWSMRLLLRCYPREFRDEHGLDLAELYEDLRRKEGMGRWQHLRLASSFAVDGSRIRVAGWMARIRASNDKGGDGNVRDMWIVEFKQALRVFRRSPGFAAAVALTLAVGIGGTTSIFSLVNGLLLRPIAGIQDQERLAAIETSEFGGAFGVSAYMDYLDFVERSRAFSQLAAFKPRQVDAAAQGTTEPLHATMVTSSYFDVLGVTPYAGRFFGPEVDQGVSAHPQVVLTHGLFRRWFGDDPSIVGRDFVLNGLAYEVIGVAPPDFRGTSMVEVPDVFVPMTMQPNLMPGSGYLLDRRGWGGVSVVGRLAQGVTAEAAGSEIDALGLQLGVEHPQTNDSRAYGVVPFREAAMPGGARGSVIQLSVLLLSIVAALWLVVCLNVANLFLARSMKRRQELAVRLAMGAGRARITGQLTLEFMSIAVVAGLLGIVIARAVAGGVAALPIPIVVDVSLDYRTVGFVGILAIASGALCALVPAITLSGTDPRTAASPSTWLRPSRLRWPSRALIVAQISLSVLLLSATGMFVRTFANLTSADPGFDPDSILTARFNPALQGYDGSRVADFYERLEETARAIPGVVAVTMADALPAAGNFGSDGWFFENAIEPEQSSSIFFSAVSATYFPTLELPILAGRGFTAGDTPGQPLVLVVNEAAARLIELRTGRPALGAGMSFSDPTGPFLEVVGVVGDSRTGRTSEAPPFVYGAHPQVLGVGFGGTEMVMMLKTSIPPDQLAPAFRRAAAAVDPNVAAGNVITMDRFLADLLAIDRLTVAVLGVSSLLALLLVALGVYGLLAYVVTQRTREFGVRLALGARAANLKTIVLYEALVLAGVGLGVGVAFSLVLTRSIEGFLVGVGPADPVAMGLGVATVVAVTLAAAYVPSRRAMKADPMVAMQA